MHSRTRTAGPSRCRTFDMIPDSLDLVSDSAQDLPVLNVQRGERSCLTCGCMKNKG